MGQPKNRPPIDLAGIRRGGPSKDGSAVQFSLEARDGKLFTFTMPHEAIGEVVQVLLALGDAAATLRPKSTFETGAPVQVRPFPLQGFEISHLPDGTVVLTMKSRNWLKHSLALEPPTARSLAEELQNLVRRISN